MKWRLRADTRGTGRRAACFLLRKTLQCLRDIRLCHQPVYLLKRPMRPRLWGRNMRQGDRLRPTPIKTTKSNCVEPRMGQPVKNDDAAGTCGADPDAPKDSHFVQYHIGRTSVDMNLIINCEPVSSAGADSIQAKMENVVSRESCAEIEDIVQSTRFRAVANKGETSSRLTKTPLARLVLLLNTLVPRLLPSIHSRTNTF